MALGNDPPPNVVDQAPDEALGQAPAFGMKRGIALVALGLLGLGVSGYLTYIHYRGGTYLCGGLGDCDYVNSSPYAVLLGIPVAVYGFAAYAVILGTVLAAMRSQSEAVRDHAPLAVFAVAVVGVLFSAYLSYIELYVIYAI